MLRSGLRRAAAASAPLRTLRRNLNLHEYQSAALMAEKGVNVPFGLPATTVEEAVAAAATIGDEEVVIKSQILAGGRGLGSFTNGLKGGVHVIKTSEVAEYAGKMLGGTLVTKQVRLGLGLGTGLGLGLASGSLGTHGGRSAKSSSGTPSGVSWGTPHRDGSRTWLG